MEQPDGATEANQRDEILRSFSAGGAYSKRRDLWLLVSARNSETRSRLRNDGILHLADVLQRDDFDAVECLAKVWSRSKVERESSSKALGVTAFKANEAQSYGGKAKYLMFGSSPPGDSVTVQSQLQQGRYADSTSTSTSTSTPLPPPSPPPPPPRRSRRAGAWAPATAGSPSLRAARGADAPRSSSTRAFVSPTRRATRRCIWRSKRWRGRRRGPRGPRAPRPPLRRRRARRGTEEAAVAERLTRSLTMMPRWGRS